MIVAKYKFDPNTYADLLPSLPSNWTYTKSDVTNSDGTITRTLESSSAFNSIRFGDVGGNANNQTKALLEVISLDLTNCTSAKDLFNACGNLVSVKGINSTVGKLTDLSYLFQGCKSLSQVDLSGLDTSKVKNFARMFTSCSTLTNIDLSSFDTSQVTNMAMMFNNCSSLTQLEVSNFDTSKVIDMSNMFQSCSSLTQLDLSNFDTSKVTSMAYMFGSCSSLEQLDISNFDTSQVTNMYYMFSGCSSLAQLDLSNFNTSKVTNTDSMFKGCSSLTQLDLSNFDTSQVTGIASMFYGCSKLTELNLPYFNTSKVTKMTYMFLNCSSLAKLTIPRFDTSKATEKLDVFHNCSKLYKVDLRYASQSTLTTIHDLLLSRSSTTKGYILSPYSLESSKNWSIVKCGKVDILLPQPLRKIANMKDRLYWDEDKGHYCIEQNIKHARITGDSEIERNWIEKNSFTITPNSTGFSTSFTLYSQSQLSQFTKCDSLRPLYYVFDSSYPTDNTYRIGDGRIFLAFKDINNIDDAKLWLNEHPLNFYVNDSTTTIIDLPHMNQKLTLDSYNPTTYMDVTNLPLNPSKLELDAPIDRYRNVNLQPSTQYNVQFDCMGTNEIKVNLGGTTINHTPLYPKAMSRVNLTITTPSSLTTDKLEISNSGSTIDNVMLFSEVIAQEPDYIDSIQSIGELQDNGTYKIDVSTKYEGLNLALKKGIFSSGGISVLNGVVDSNTNAIVSDFIKCKYKEKIFFRQNCESVVGASYTKVCFYDKNKTFIYGESLGALPTTRNHEYTIYSGAYYFRICFESIQISQLGVSVFPMLSFNKFFTSNTDSISSSVYNDVCKESTQSIYLPQSLRKKGNAKDKFYWDDNKGYYCIEQNISDNLEVLSSPNIIDLPEMNQKFSFDTYLPNTYVDVTNLPLQPYKLQLEDDTVRYKSTIEPSTLYTIQFNCVSKLTTRLTLDLGGSRVTVDPIIGVNHVQITTPSELTSNRLFMIGTGIMIREVIVNKGEMNQYPNYFDGEQSVGELQDDGTYLIGIKTNEGFNIFIQTNNPLTKDDKLYWNPIDRRYEIDRGGSIEVPTVTGDIVDLPRLYQKVDTTISISTDNIEPSKIEIEYKDINNN